MLKKISFLFLIVSIALSACGTLEVNLDQTPTPVVDANFVATMVAATLAAFPSATPAPTIIFETSLSACRFDRSPFPFTSYFTPVDGKDAIAYSSIFSSDVSHDGLTLLFLDTGKTIPLHKLKELGLTGADMGLSWSPDGTKIAFLYSESGQTKSPAYLMLADLTLGEVCTLTEQPAIYSHPVWSPDGKMIALVDYDSAQIKLISLDNSPTIAIGNNVYETYGAPLEWPDSENLIYIRMMETESEGDLVNQPLNGTSQTILLEKIGFQSFSYSPDGKWLAYNSDDNTMLKNLESGVEQNLVNSATDMLYWSPDGNYLLGKFGLSRLWLVQPNVSIQVTQLDFSGCLGSQPWAADSKHFTLLLCTDGKPASIKIAVYDLSSKVLKELVVDARFPSFPVWNQH